MTTLAGNVYAVTARLWRADRYGTRLERVPLDVPVQGTIEYNEDTESKHKLSLEVNRPGFLRPFLDYLIPELTLIGLDGVPHTAALGHYIVTPPATRLTASRFSGTIEGRSIVWLLASDTLADGLTIPAAPDPRRERIAMSQQQASGGAGVREALPWLIRENARC